MIRDEIHVSYEKASELLAKYGSVRKAVENYKG
jgi:N-acetylmuramic acid 6-phosphate etherase